MPQIIDYVISIICGAVKSSTEVPILIQVDKIQVQNTIHLDDRRFISLDIRRKAKRSV